jgi:prolyl-tRNA synthetase
MDKSDQVRETTERLYDELRAAGVDVLLDDRGLRPGAMFADIELIGIPHRIVIGDRALDAGNVEYRARAAADNEMIPLDEIVERITKTLKDSIA